MNPQIVRIKGISHNYFLNNPYRGSLLPVHDSILYHRISEQKMLCHKNELAVRMPGLEDMFPKEIYVKSPHDPFPFSYSLQADDVPLVQFDKNQAGAPITLPSEDNSGFRVVIAKAGEFKPVLESQLPEINTVSSGFPAFLEAESILSGFKYDFLSKDGFLFLKYHRNDLTKDDRNEFESTLPKVHHSTS